MINFFSSPIYAEWDIKGIQEGEIVYHDVKQNLIVQTGRSDVLGLLFGMASTCAQPIVSLAAGACSTAAAVTDTRLNYELIANGNRLTLTDTGSSPLSCSDIVSETFTDGLGNTYYKKVIVQGIYLTTDANNGQPFQEYGLMTTLPCPATPTTISGIMFNHLVASAPIIKNNSTQIVVQITIRV